MIINLETNRHRLKTWRHLAAWYHVHWLRIVGSLDYGLLTKEDIANMMRRYYGRLNADLHAEEGPVRYYRKDTEDTIFRDRLEKALWYLDNNLRYYDRLDLSQLATAVSVISECFSRP